MRHQVIMLLVSAVAVFFSSADPQAAHTTAPNQGSNPAVGQAPNPASNQVIGAGVTPAPVPSVTGPPLPISSNTIPPAPPQSPPHVVPPPVTGAPPPISSNTIPPATGGTQPPISSNTIPAATGVPLFSVHPTTPARAPSGVPSTTPSPAPMPASNPLPQPPNPPPANPIPLPSNPVSVTLVNPSISTNLSVINPHVANPNANPSLNLAASPIHLLAELLNNPPANANPDIGLLTELLSNVNANSNINEPAKQIHNPSVNPNLNAITELLDARNGFSIAETNHAEPALVELNPAEVDLFAEFIINSAGEIHSTPIVEQVTQPSTTSPQMKLLAKLLAHPSLRPVSNKAHKLLGGSFHNPYANPITDLASKPGINIESQPEPDLFKEHISTPLINFIKNPLGSLFNKHKDKVHSKSPLTRIITKHNQKMESLGNLFHSLLSPNDEANSDHSSTSPNLDGIDRSRRTVVKSKLAERIEALRRTGDSSGEKRKMFFGDCSSTTRSSCDRSSPVRKKRGFLGLKHVLNFVRFILKIFGINIPDKLFGLVSGILGGPGVNNSTTTSQSSTENVVKSDVQYLIC